MPVYKRDDSETYSFDFRYKGARYSGNTGCKTKREAEKYEQQQRQIAKKLAEQAAGPMTVALAVVRYWDEVGQHHVNDETTLKNLAWLENTLGKNTFIASIRSADVARIIAQRRLPDAEGRSPSAATVNRSVTQPLRAILRRAADVWGQKVQRIKWGDHLLEENQERVREATIGEEAAIMGELDRGYDDAVRFAFLTGCRRMEILGLEWPHVDFFSKRFTVTGKGRKLRTIPMSQAVFDLLWAVRNNHETKVFTYEAKRTLKKLKLVRGNRYPLTESGLKTAMRRAVPKAGVSNFRFHDTRHTAATRVLRASNLRVVQNLLGHKDIATTTKYAHAVDDDIRNALDAVEAQNATKNATAEATISANQLGKGRKSE